LTGRSRRKRRGIKVTKGDLNRIIDDIFHKRFSENLGFVIVDGLLHAVVERDPEESDLKFVKYNVPVLVREMTRKKRVKGKRRRKKKKGEFMSWGLSCWCRFGAGWGVFCQLTMFLQV
jgi:hypothetical protein